MVNNNTEDIEMHEARKQLAKLNRQFPRLQISVKPMCCHFGVVPPSKPTSLDVRALDSQDRIAFSFVVYRIESMLMWTHLHAIDFKESGDVVEYPADALTRGLNQAHKHAGWRFESCTSVREHGFEKSIAPRHYSATMVRGDEVLSFTERWAHNLDEFISIVNERLSLV